MLGPLGFGQGHSAPEQQRRQPFRTSPHVTGVDGTRTSTAGLTSTARLGAGRGHARTASIARTDIAPTTFHADSARSRRLIIAATSVTRTAGVAAVLRTSDPSARMKGARFSETEAPPLLCPVAARRSLHAIADVSGVGGTRNGMDGLGAHRARSTAGFDGGVACGHSSIGRCSANSTSAARAISRGAAVRIASAAGHGATCAAASVGGHATACTVARCTRRGSTGTRAAAGSAVAGAADRKEP
jgi:hypothetical protein